MQSMLDSAVTAFKSVEPPNYEKRIGSTVYRVIVHFSQDSNDTIEDKLIRLMESKVRENA
jgi:hypothetical protein